MSKLPLSSIDTSKDQAAAATESSALANYDKMGNEEAKVESPSIKAFKHLMKNDSQFPNCVNLEIHHMAKEIETKMKEDKIKMRSQED